jgi:hypothetical protein
MRRARATIKPIKAGQPPSSSVIPSIALNIIIIIIIIDYSKPDKMPAFPISDPPTQPLVPYQDMEDTGLPFEAALQRLHSTLTEALAFFSQLNHSFNQDTKTVSNYTKTSILDQIWKAKVAAAKHGLPQQQLPESTWQKHKATLKAKIMGSDGNGNNYVNPCTITTGFHDYIKRIQKDLFETVHARWPRGIKTGLEHEMTFNIALICLSYMYHRMAEFASNLQRFDKEIQQNHSMFRGFVREAELLQISLEQNEEFWQH